MARLHLTLPMLCILFFSGCTHSRFDPAVEGQNLLQRDAEWSQAASEGKDIERILSYWSGSIRTSVAASGTSATVSCAMAMIPPSANVVRDLKGFMRRVRSVVNVMNSTAHD
jgi:hypothetical protein